MKKNSQQGMILSYMQNHKNKKVSGKDFMGRLFMPFVGYSANCRLSELLKEGLVKEAGIRKGILRFTKRMPMKLYKITENGLDTNII